MHRTSFAAAMLLAACGAQSNPTPSTDDSSTPSSTGQPETTAVAEETSAPVETAAPTTTSSAKASSTPMGLGHSTTEATSCTELAKKKCQVTRGCMWNDIHKCVKEETQ